MNLRNSNTSLDYEREKNFRECRKLFHADLHTWNIGVELSVEESFDRKFLRFPQGER